MEREEKNEDEMLVSSSDNETEDLSQEEINYDAVSEFYRILSENFDSAIEKSPMGDFLFNQIKSGSRTVYSKTIRETKVFEKSFIPMLEQAFRSISKILKDPKKAIRYEQEVVPMEKAKKVNSETVRHLASHTQFIKEVKDNGDIIPSKLLTTYTEDEVGIYENRFIKTLINRICKFLSLRLQIMKKNLESYETKSTAVTNNFSVEKTKIKVELNVKMERTLDAQVKQARDTYKKAQKIHEDFKTLRSSKLMQDLKNYKEVTPPILKTNIILKNPEFKICYNTWVFLDRYNELAFDVNVKERKNKYPDSLAASIDAIMSEAVGTMLYYNGDSDIDPENMPYKEFTTRKAKMLSKMDDEYKFNPSSQKVEKFEMSEYFLNKTQEFYQQSLDDKLSSGMEKKYSLELVFKEMQEVLNSIYPPLFELPYEEENMYEDIPLSVKLERAQKKAEVLETITRLKELDYENTKKDYDDTLALIASTEEKIRQQKAREERLERLAKEKALRAEKRAQEREEARIKHEEEVARRKEEREAERLRREELKAEEKARMLEAKEKLMARRAEIKAEQERLKAERAAERARKKAEREEAEKAREAERLRIEEEERKLEAEKSHIDAKELLRRRREIIKQKAAAQKALEEARRREALEDAMDDDEDDESVYSEIDQQLKELEASENEGDEVSEDTEEPEETLDAKDLLRQRREAIRRKALYDRNNLEVLEEEEKKEDPRQDFKDRIESKKALFETPSVTSDEEDSEEKPEILDNTEEDSKTLFERNRDIIRRRAELQRKRNDEDAKPEEHQIEAKEEDTKPEDKTDEVDPKELLRQRREAIRRRALEAQAQKVEPKQQEEAVDPKELLRRRREAIMKKALEAQKNHEEDN